MKNGPKAALAAGILVAGVLLFIAIQATAKPPVKTDQDRILAPLVTTQVLQSQDHRFHIDVWAEVVPREQTRLTPQVSGRIVALHPNFVAGGVITKGEVMATLDDADYQAALLSAQAALAAALAQLEQETAMARVAEQELRHLSAEQLTALALRKPQLHSAEAGVKSAQAALHKAERDLERTRISAPYDALVVSRGVGLGQVVSAGTALAEIYSIEQAELHVPVAGFDLPFLPEQMAGIPADVHFDGQRRRGAVVRDLGIVNGQTRMHHLVVQLDDPYSVHSSEPVLRFGSYVQVTLAGRLQAQVFVLPQDAVHNQQVWLVDDNNTLRRQPVQVLRQEAKLVLISGGLKQGDRLVLSLPNFPQPGMAVRFNADGSQVAQAE